MQLQPQNQKGAWSATTTLNLCFWKHAMAKATPGNVPPMSVYQLFPSGSFLGIIVPTGHSLKEGNLVWCLHSPPTAKHARSTARTGRVPRQKLYKLFIPNIFFSATGKIASCSKRIQRLIWTTRHFTLHRKGNTTEQNM